TGQDFDKLENIPVFADSQVLTEVREEIYQANQKIKELSKKYGPKHPVMIKAREDVKLLQQEKRFEIQRIVDATRSSYGLAASKEENLKELLDETKGEVLDLNEKFVQYSILKREVDSNRLLYDTLQTNIKKENITEQTQTVNIWVIDKAELPMAPSKPNKKRTLMLAMVLGLFGGVGLAFLIEYLDNTVKSEAELEKRFGRTVLGSVEQIGKKESIESYVLKQPLSPLAESYRLIRSGLLLSSADQPPGTILVTSMEQNEGKTSTTVNVARVLAQDQKKVLIIDCDLRRPRMHKLFRLENKEGLSNYLSGNIDTVAVAEIADEPLSVITSGPVPPNPSELLSSKRMLALLAEMEETFDFVLLDSPPVQSVTDSLALASAASGTIVVVHYGKTTYDMLAGGMKKLNDVNTQVLGFVINGLKKGDAGAYYYGYSGYYRKYT
ncbi:polysaccharide biosynthesis tyrosine autokinase, partial [Thermodesulfobacteriota bacterium]